MSPRKTRRAAKLDGANETLSETVSNETENNTPVQSQRITRTRRGLTKVGSADSDVDQTPSSMATRSRRKLMLETTVDQLSVPAIIPTRRTRRAKANDTLSDRTLPLDSTTANTSIATKSRPARTPRTAVKNSKSKDNEKSAEAVPDKTIDSKEVKNVTINEDIVDVATSCDSTAPMSIEDDEVQRVSSTISRYKSVIATPGKRRRRNARIANDECTPESSPITVNLSPHRSNKTPRKSPVNLGSPKSHTDTSLRLSKTPRKLPIVADSPVPSDKSVGSMTGGTSKNGSAEKSSYSDSPESVDSKIKRRRLRSPGSKISPRRHRKSSSNLVAIRKFSKSPKIVLRTPKAKSPKKKSPRVVASKLKKPTMFKQSTKSTVKSSKSPNGARSITSVGEKSSSPKIVRKSLSPKKSKTSPSPKKTTESLSQKKTRESLSPKKTRESLSPKKTRKSLSPKKSRESAASATLFDSPATRMSLHLSRVDSPSRVPKSPIGSRNSSLIAQTKQLVQLPTIVLDKTSLTNFSKLEASTRSRRSSATDGSSRSTPVITQIAEKLPNNVIEHPRRPKSLTSKRAPITDLGTPLRPIDTPRGSVGKSIIISSSTTPMEIARSKIGNGGPMLSSTPRERIRRSLNLSPGLGVTLGLADSPLNGAAPAKSSTMIDESRGKHRSSRIEDESNPLMNDNEATVDDPSGDKSDLNGTYEVSGTIVAENETEQPGNGTYELAEPKTPNLRRKGAKRSLSDMDTSAEDRAGKRTCRVRFASPSMDDTASKTLAIVVGKSRLAPPGYSVRQKIDNVRRTPGNEISVNKYRRRSNSVTSVSLIKTPVTKRRSNSVTDGSDRSARIKEQNASINRLSKPRLSVKSSTKKQEVKNPEVRIQARKTPNFAQIHQKKFAQMESIVDAKKRVEKRHIAMTSQNSTVLTKAVNNEIQPKPTVSGKPTTPGTAVNGAYNRYGFKLRKTDAVKYMTQKQPMHKSEKNQTESRTLLKGVRTNRRFDLIMKARNINL